MYDLSKAVLFGTLIGIIIALSVQLLLILLLSSVRIEALYEMLHPLRLVFVAAVAGMGGGATLFKSFKSVHWRTALLSPLFVLPILTILAVSMNLAYPLPEKESAFSMMVTFLLAAAIYYAAFVGMFAQGKLQA